MIYAACYGLLGSCAIGAAGIAFVQAFARAFPDAGPVARYRCWSTLLLAMALSPVFCMASVTVWKGDIRVAPPPAPAVLAGVHFARRSVPALPASKTAAALPQKNAMLPSLFASLALIWFLVAAWYILRVAIAVGRVRQIKRNGLELFAFKRSQPRGTRLYLSRAVCGPITAGYLHPAIVLPYSFLAQTSDTDLERIVLHELAHIRRRDDWAMLFERVVAAMLWFNPVVPYVAHRLALERELACDRDVVRRTGSPARYAELLWKLAQNERGGDAGLAPAAVPLRSHVALRLQCLLQDGDIAKNPRIRPLVAATTTALCALLLFLGTFVSPSFARQQFSRTDFTTVLLRDGNTLVLGGRLPDGSFMASAQVSDTRTGAILARPMMQVARAGATATLLADGTVLVAGGWTRAGVTARAEIYLPSQHVFVAAGTMTYPRADHAATLLPDGRVVFVGGRSAVKRFISTPEFYDTAAGRFVRAASDGDERMGLATRLLANGNVLVWGGISPNGRPMNCAIAFDPVRQRFINVGFTDPVISTR